MEEFNPFVSLLLLLLANQFLALFYFFQVISLQWGRKLNVSTQQTQKMISKRQSKTKLKNC
jgi:hypothetical protein